MKEVDISLPCIRSRKFPTELLEYVLCAWPELSTLLLTFEIASTADLPDIHFIILNAPWLCPNLIRLHLPGVAAYQRGGRYFQLRTTSPSLFENFVFSSDVFFLEYHPLDIAFEIARVFRNHNPISSSFVVGSDWATIRPLVDVILYKDRENIIGFINNNWLSPWRHLIP